MKNITKAQLVGTLIGTTGAKPVTVLARTVADTRKNPFGKIFKVRRINGMVNFQYAEGVKRRLEKEGKPEESFHQGQSWHEPVLENGHLTPLAKHKTKNEKLYIRLMHLKSLGEEIYFDEGGDSLTKEQVEPYLSKKSSYSNQGLDNPLKILTIDLDGILELSMDQEVYEVTQ